MIAAARGHGMSVTAYCPIARGRVPGNPVLERIGSAHGKTASQVSLRWLVQQGIIVIPGSAKLTGRRRISKSWISRSRPPR